MNFDLTEDEQMLKAITERFVIDHYDSERRRAYQATPEGFSTESWHLLAEIGLVAAPFAPDHGGLGIGPTEIAVIAEALGHGLVVEPWIDSVLVAGQFFAATAPQALLSTWIGALTNGEKRLALAHREAGGRGREAGIETKAESVADGWRLTGAKGLVIAGVGVDAFIVSARIDGEMGYFLVPADAAGLTHTRYRLIDGSAACALELHNVTVAMDHRLNAAQDLLAKIEARANIARCAEAVGIMQMLFDTTRDYLRTRKQFSAPLASFQALQHRMVAQYAVIEQARALLDLAVMSEGEAADHAIAGARAYISDVSVTLGHEMIQLHGGMGVSDELNIGHGHKRLMLLSRYPETAAVTLDRFIGLAA